MIIRHMDTPGAIARVTGVLAQRNINIATMQAYRRQAGGDAMIVLELDGIPEEETVQTIRELSDVQGCTFLKRRSDV